MIPAEFVHTRQGPTLGLSLRIRSNHLYAPGTDTRTLLLSCGPQANHLCSCSPADQKQSYLCAPAHPPRSEFDVFTPDSDSIHLKDGTCSEGSQVFASRNRRSASTSSSGR